jgi:hypothetical protein
MRARDERERAAYRAFVREHHPDRGGDPEVFVAGLARFRASGEQVRPGQQHHPPAPAAPDDARYDAPVEVVASLPLPVKVAVALIRTVRRRRHSRGLR